MHFVHNLVTLCADQRCECVVVVVVIDVVFFDYRKNVARFHLSIAWR